MKKLLANFLFCWLILFCALADVSARAQTAVTATYNEGTTYSPVTPSGQTQFSRTHLNLGGIDNYDQGQFTKNLVASLNPGMEATELRATFPAASGTTTTITTGTIYPVSGSAAFMAANYPTGTITVMDSTTGGPVGCSYNGGSGTPLGVSVSGTDATTETVTFTLPTACGSAVQPGDFIVFDAVIQSPAPQTYLTSGATVSYSTTTPYDGLQSLVIDTTAVGSYAQISYPFDTSAYNRFVDIDGTFIGGVFARGLQPFTLQAKRGAVSFGSCSFTPTSTWTYYPCTFTGSEKTTAPGPNAVQYQIVQSTSSGTASGGPNNYDDISFVKTSGQGVVVNGSTVANPTIFRDEFVQYLIDSKMGGLRSWIYGNALTYANAIKPMMSALQTSTDFGGTASFTPTLQWPDILDLEAFLNVNSMFEEPISISNADAAKFIEYLSSTNTSSGGGADRLAHGRFAPYIGSSAIPYMDLELGNEPWNTTFQWQNFNTSGLLSSQQVGYLNRCGDVVHAQRQDVAIDNTHMKFGCGVQTGNTGGAGVLASDFNRLHTKNGDAPDYIALNKYWTSSASSYSTQALQWSEPLSEGWADEFGNAGSGYLESYGEIAGIATAGPAGTSQLYPNIYEFADGTINSCGYGSQPACSGTGVATLTQTALQQYNAGAGNALVVAQKLLDGMKYHHIPTQAFFSAIQLGNNVTSQIPNTGGSGPIYTALWGNSIDFGGAVSDLASAKYALRPVAFGQQMVNAAIIGPMHDCSNTAGTRNLPTDVNGPQIALTAVPNLECYSFTSSSGKRAHVYLNNTTNAYAVTEAGTTLSGTAVTEMQLALTNLNALNEAVEATPTYAVQVTPTNTTTPTIAPTVTSLAAPPSTINIPAYSLTVLLDAGPPVLHQIF